MKNLLLAIITITIFASCEKKYQCTRTITCTTDFPQEGCPTTYTTNFTATEEDLSYYSKDTIVKQGKFLGTGQPKTTKEITTCDKGKRSFK